MTDESKNKLVPNLRISSLDISNKMCFSSFSALYKEDPNNSKFPVSHLMLVSAKGVGTDTFTINLKQSETLLLYISCSVIAAKAEDNSLREGTKTIATRGNGKNLTIKTEPNNNGHSKAKVTIFFNLSASSKNYIELNKLDVILIKIKAFEVLKSSFSTLSDQTFQSMLDSHIV